MKGKGEEGEKRQRVGVCSGYQEDGGCGRLKLRMQAKLQERAPKKMKEQRSTVEPGT